LTLICYCHLVGMAKIVRGSTFSTTMRHRYLTIWLTYCTKPGIALALYYNLISTLFFRLVAEHSMLMFIRGLLNFCKYQLILILMTSGSIFVADLSGLV